jgi:hypothetical protein
MVLGEITSLRTRSQSRPSGRPTHLTATRGAFAGLPFPGRPDGGDELAARANAEARYPAEREANEIYDQVREVVVEIRAAIAAATAQAWRR